MEKTAKQIEATALNEITGWLSEDGHDFGMEFDRDGNLCVVTCHAFEGWQEWAEESGTPCIGRLSGFADDEIMWTATFAG